MTDAECTALLAEGYFRVDADGSVWRLLIGTRTGGRRSIAPTRADYVENNGYRRIRFGKTGTITAHRLVWLALRGPIPDGMEINHKNGDKADNRIGNLEPVSHLDNVRHAYRELDVPRLIGEANGQSKLTEGQAIEIRRLVAGGQPRRVVARRFGVSKTVVGNIVDGRAWKHAAMPGSR